MDADVLVIGAGIAGASLGYFLAPHARVLLVEREPHPGMHATGRSAALFSETYGSAQVRALTRASRAFLERPPEGFAAQPLLRPRGALVFGDAAQLGRVREAYETMRPHTPGLELWDGTQLRDAVPVLRPQAAQLGFYEAGAADIDVDALHQGFLRGLRARGGGVLLDAEVVGIAPARDGWELALAGDRMLRAPLLVDAAGAWADRVAALAGVAPLGIEPRRRSAFLFEPPPGVDTAHWPFVCEVEERFYFKPDAGLLLGSPANADPMPPHDVQPEMLDIALAIDRIEQATTMSIRRPLRSWAGLRSFVADGDLVGGFAPDAAHFFWLAAQGGYGIQTCAAMGEACAQLVLGRALPAHLQDHGLSAAMLAPRAVATAA